MDGVADNFLGLPDQLAAYETARVAVLPVPYDATTSYNPGTRNGPRAIITASQQVEWYDTDLARESQSCGIATLPALEPDVRGPAAMQERIYRAARRVVRDDKFLLTLGGEHGISTALVRAVRSRHRKLSVLQIDAHADLRDEYQGSPDSHAAVMRRIQQLGVHSVGVGLRSFSKPEAQRIRRDELLRFTARACHTLPDWIERSVDALHENVYVTIDIDGFDPAAAPGTGTPEPGGLDWFQVTDLLAAVARQRRIVAADIVEVSPTPGSHVTEFLAARLAYRVIGLACPPTRRRPAKR